MRNRGVRLAFAAALLVAGLAAGYLAQRLQQRAEEVLASEHDVSGRLEQMIATVNEVGAAQRAYVAPGQPKQRWLQRVVELVQQLEAGATAIRPRLQSADATSHLQAFAEGLTAFVKLNNQVGENLESGQEQVAADLIFTDGRDNLSTIVKTLQDLQRGEQAASGVSRAALIQQSWTIFGSAAALWALGLIVLAAASGGKSALPAPREIAPLPAVDPPQSVETAPSAPSIDLATAADICTTLSRLTTTAALPDVLARAAALLDASVIIVWLGAGEELFAATVHGYDSRIVSRLGPIGREANNATAAAWRSGELTTVRGDIMSNGAVVAPMFSADGCIGVLAAEVRHGREDDPATRAVTAMIAAQIATAVAAWPLSSVKTAAEDVPPAAGGSVPASVGGG